MTRPALIKNLNSGNQNCAFIKPLSQDKPPYDEEWLQRLVQEHPDLIPASEIEPCFNTLVPVLMEYSLPSGYLDNFFITPDGYPILVEVKLWKNQESRRKVVAQILEYAKDFAALSYDDLNSEYTKKNPATRGQENPLYNAVTAYAPDALEETAFVDRVSRNLREGRFLLIILGDGIREELANLTEYLLHHSLRYAFGLVQVKLFELPDKTVIALPSLMGKAQTIERHVTVVTTQGEGLTVSEKPSVINERTEKTSLSTDEFFKKLAALSPQSVSWLKNIETKLGDLPAEWFISGEYASLVAPLSGGEPIILAKLNLKNNIEFWGIPNKKRKNQVWRELSKIYLNSLSALVPGSFVKVFESGHMDLYNKETGKHLPVEMFFGKEETFVEVLRQVITKAEEFFQEESA